MSSEIFQSLIQKNVIEKLSIHYKEDQKTNFALAQSSIL